MASAQLVKVLGELSAIAAVREAIARTEWNEAEAHRRFCEDEERVAEERAQSAYEDWSACVSSSLLGPGSIRVAASFLIAGELAMSGARKQHEAASREADDKASEARLTRAGAETGAARLAKARRRHEAAHEERLMGELGDLMLARRLRPR